MENLVKKDYDNNQIQLIKDMYAKNTTKDEFELFMYTAGKYGLDPLIKQIWCVKFGTGAAQIYAGRDGFLEIAHRDGKFNGMESGMKDDHTAFAKVYRKDMEHPFYVEVDMAEYSTGQSLWKTKPKTMLIKVAESQALRKAFSISGLYAPEEMSQWEADSQGIKYPSQINAKNNAENSSYDRSNENPDDKPKEKISDKTGKSYIPKVTRLYTLATKVYGLNDKDFKELCIRVTGKEHSRDYTNKDCWDIEDELIKTVNNTEEITESETVEAEYENTNYADIAEQETLIK
ncbi:MAG: RecT family recombinase [Methanobacterium sp.]